jgi:MFS family permease
MKTASLTLVGTVLAMYGLWQAVIRIPAGIGVDVTGRGKPFIILGFLLSGSGAVVMAFGNTTFTLALGRALTGLAAGTWVPLVGVFNGLFPKEKAVLATSLLNMSGQVGRLLATSSNGVLNNLGGYSLAFLVAAASCVAAIVIISLAPLPKKEPAPPSLGSFWRLLTRRDVLLPTLIQIVVMLASWAVTFSFLPILASQLGASDVLKSLMISANVAILIVGNLANTLIDRRVPHRLTLVMAFTVMAGGALTASLARSVVALFVATGMMGLANGFAYPTLMGMSIGNVSPREKTTATGIHQAVYAIGMFTGPLYAGFTADLIGIRAMFVLTAALTLVLAYGMIAMLPREVG